MKGETLVFRSQSWNFSTDLWVEIGQAALLCKGQLRTTVEKEWNSKNEDDEKYFQSCKIDISPLRQFREAQLGALALSLLYGYIKRDLERLKIFLPSTLFSLGDPFWNGSHASPNYRHRGLFSDCCLGYRSFSCLQSHPHIWQAVRDSPWATNTVCHQTSNHGPTFWGEL